MSDIFHEVEEEVRRERLEKLWKTYGDYVIAVAMVLVVGVAGFKFWQHYQDVETQKASAAYIQALEMAGSGKVSEATAAFAQIAKTAPHGYAMVAKLSQADMLQAAGKTQEAIALYKKIADEDSKDIGQTARVRAAWAMADSASRADLEKLLEPVSTDQSGWRFMSRELLAYVDFRDGRLKNSQKAFLALAADKAAPDGVRDRAKAMAALIQTGVGDYGILPPPEETPAAGGAQDASTSKENAPK